MVFHGREPIKKCYAEFENYGSLADTNFVKTSRKIVEKIEEKVKIFQSIRILQKLLKSEKDIVKSFKTFLSNCDISKNLPNSVEKYSNRIKKVPKGFWIDEIIFLPKSYKTYRKWMKKKRVSENLRNLIKNEDSVQGLG